MQKLLCVRPTLIVPKSSALASATMTCFCASGESFSFISPETGSKADKEAPALPVMMTVSPG